MLFSLSVACGLCLSFAQAARLTNGAQDFTGVTAGQPLTITWSDATGPVTLLLKSGSSTNLQTVSTIASGQTGTSYSWTPDTALPSGTYAIEIDDASGPNYSVQFPITSSSTSSTTPSVPGATSVYSTGYSSGYSSYIPSASLNSTSSYTSAYPTSSYYYTNTQASTYPTASANLTSQAPAAATSAPLTVPSSVNSASGFMPSLALAMFVIAASLMI